jgi:cobalamin biosynthesis protein CobT
LYDDDVQPLIASGESIAANANRFNLDTMGGTPMSDAMWYCIHQLVAQKEDRKILLIVTDGQPNNEQSVVDLLKLVTPAGIEVMALGIKEKSVNRIFPVAQSIDNVNELSGALFQMVGSSLLKAS